MATTRLRPFAARSVVVGGATVVGALALTLGIAACGDDEGGNTAAFCGRVEDNREQLFGGLPDPLTPEAAAEFRALVDQVGAVAPLEIEADWDAWAHTIEIFTTSTDREEVLATGYAFQESALAINDWLQANCGFDIGVPIGTLPPLGATAAPSVADLPVDTVLAAPAAATTAPPG